MTIMSAALYHDHLHRLFISGNIYNKAAGILISKLLILIKDL